ncbi:MAG: hypothetical protein Ta2A_08000 [Treponemataceae bacterium]|nr:MAG: hypothetical protein Ta2A_08000 [Treponemataceae bacterium]
MKHKLLTVFIAMISFFTILYFAVNIISDVKHKDFDYFFISISNGTDLEYTIKTNDGKTENEYIVKPNLTNTIKSKILKNDNNCYITIIENKSNQIVSEKICSRFTEIKSYSAHGGLLLPIIISSNENKITVEYGTDWI